MFQAPCQVRRLRRCRWAARRRRGLRPGRHLRRSDVRERRLLGGVPRQRRDLHRALARAGRRHVRRPGRLVKVSRTDAGSGAPCEAVIRIAGVKTYRVSLRGGEATVSFPRNLAAGETYTVSARYIRRPARSTTRARPRTASTPSRRPRPRPAWTPATSARVSARGPTSPSAPPRPPRPSATSASSCRATPSARTSRRSA